MITLSDTTQTIDYSQTATTTNPVELVFAFADSSDVIYKPSGQRTTSSATGPTTLIGAPVAGQTRQVKYLSVFNADTVSNTFTFFQSVSGNRSTLRRVVLATLESLVWDGMSWRTFTASGAEKIDTGAVGGGSSGFVSAQRIFQSGLTVVNAALTSAAVGYWAYVGQMESAVTVKFAEFIVSTAGVGAQTAEIGLFSSPNPPNKANQTLTKLVATATVDTLATTGVKRNTASFAQVVAANVHLWAGIRISMVTTQPQIIGLANDYAQGQILTAAAPGALTGAGPFTGSIIAADLSAQWRVPDLRVTLD